MKLTEAVEEASAELEKTRESGSSTQMISRKALIKLVQAARRLERVRKTIWDHDLSDRENKCKV